MRAQPNAIELVHLCIGALHMPAHPDNSSLHMHVFGRSMQMRTMLLQ